MGEIRDPIYGFITPSETEFEDGYDRHIAIFHDGVNSLEQFVLAKYYMTTQVYRHKTRSISDAMIIRGLELGIANDDINFLKRLYCYKDEDTYIDDYLDWWDERVINELVFSTNRGYAHDIFTRLHKRQLFKRLFSEKLKDIETKDEKVKGRLINITSKENKEFRKKLEEQIACIDLLKYEREYVVANSFTIKSVKELSRDSEGEIIVIDREGNRKSFEEESTVFSSIDESMKDVYIEVYAPLEFIDEKDKNKKIIALREEILKIMGETEV